MEAAHREYGFYANVNRRWIIPLEPGHRNAPDGGVFDQLRPIKTRGCSTLRVYVESHVQSLDLPENIDPDLKVVLSSCCAWFPFFLLLGWAFTGNLGANPSRSDHAHHR
jgi:hypothetical protein